MVTAIMVRRSRRRSVPSSHHLIPDTGKPLIGDRLSGEDFTANNLDPQRDSGRPEPVALLGSGSDPSFGFDRGDCLDVGRRAD